MDVLEKLVNEAMECERATGNHFPVSLDDIWQLLGYSRKDHAVHALLALEGLVEGIQHNKTSPHPLWTLKYTSTFDVDLNKIPPHPLRTFKYTSRAIRDP